jgi:methenyltetrahydromethanopterin cyclohydrolase
MISESVITCPKCGNSAAEPMPENAWPVFMIAGIAGERLKPMGEIADASNFGCCIFFYCRLDRTCPKMVAAITASLGSAGYQSEPFCGILGA